MRCVIVSLLTVLHLAGQVSYDRLRRADLEPGNWPTYSGNYSAHRYSRLNQITTVNVKRLQLAWAYQVRTTEKIETSPLVVDGIMYLSEPGGSVVPVHVVLGTGDQFLGAIHLARPHQRFDRRTEIAEVDLHRPLGRHHVADF